MISNLDATNQRLFDRIFEDVDFSDLEEEASVAIPKIEGEAGGGGSSSAPTAKQNSKKHKFAEITGGGSDSRPKKAALEREDDDPFFLEIESMSCAEIKEELKKLAKTTYRIAAERLCKIVTVSNNNSYSIGIPLISLLDKRPDLAELVNTKIADVVTLKKIVEKKIKLTQVPEEKLTETICLVGIQNSHSLFMTHELSQKTRNVCKYAVRQNGLNLKYVDEGLKDSEICHLALNRSAIALRYFPTVLKTKEVCDNVLLRNIELFKYTPPEFQTYETCLKVVKIKGVMLKDIPKKFIDRNMCLEAAKSSAFSLEFIPKRHLTYELVCEAFKTARFYLGCPLHLVPEEFRTVEFCVNFTLNFRHLWSWVPSVATNWLEVFERVLEVEPNYFKGEERHLNSSAKCHPEFLTILPESYKRKEWSLLFPEQVRSEFKTYTQVPKEGESVELLFTTLKTYTEIHFSELESSILERGGSIEEVAEAAAKKAKSLSVIEEGYDKLIYRKPFLGTPSEANREILDGWYAHILGLISKLSNKIDPDPKKDSASKEQLIEMFGVCGGGWQAQLEQMHSNLVVYKDASPKVMVAVVIKKFGDDVISEIHQAYSQSEKKLPNVHDLNRIRLIVKGYLPDEVLSDHLSEIKWTDKEIIDRFLEKYSTSNLIKALSEAYRIDGSALQEGLATYVNTEMFKGCKQTYEIKAKLAEQRKEFIELIGDHETNKTLPWYQMSASISTGIPKGEISIKTAEELLSAFDEMKQPHLEDLALERFNAKHREDLTGLITDEGLAEILNSLGFFGYTERLIETELPRIV